jgi:hypothetical protein
MLLSDHGWPIKKNGCFIPHLGLVSVSSEILARVFQGRKLHWKGTSIEQLHMSILSWEKYSEIF